VPANCAHGAGAFWDRNFFLVFDILQAGLSATEESICEAHHIFGRDQEFNWPSSFPSGMFSAAACRVISDSFSSRVAMVLFVEPAARRLHQTQSS
jgi:hypothetical protein